MAPIVDLQPSPVNDAKIGNVFTVVSHKRAQRLWSIEQTPLRHM